MFRLGRLQSPRKVQAVPCADPARTAVLSERFATRLGSHRNDSLRVARGESKGLSSHPGSTRLGSKNRMAVLSEWFATRLGSQQRDPIRVGVLSEVREGALLRAPAKVAHSESMDLSCHPMSFLSRCPFRKLSSASHSSLATNHYPSPLSPTRHAGPSNFSRKRMKTIIVATHYSTLQKANANPSMSPRHCLPLIHKANGRNRNLRFEPHPHRAYLAWLERT